MRRALPLVLLLLLFFVAGCGEKQVRLERRPKLYRTIVSLSPSTSEIIASDGDAMTLKGRTAACNFPEAMMKTVPIVATIKPDYEKIAQIKPDLIVYDKSLYSDQDIDKLKSTGAELFCIDADNINDLIKQLYVLGSKLAWETRFSDYIGRIQNEKSTVMATPFSPVPKVAIILADKTGNDLICGTDSFLADATKIAGGSMVGPKGKIFVPMNAEALVSMNPDVIITGGSKTDVTQPGSLIADPRLKTISAVKSGKVWALDSDVLLRKGQRVDGLLHGIHGVLGKEHK